MRVRWGRGVRGVLVVAFWAGAMLLLARHERLAQRPREAPPVEWAAEVPARPSADARETWMGIYLNGTKLGYATNRITPMGAGCRIANQSHLTLPLQGRRCLVETLSAVEIGADHRLRTFDFRLRSDVQTIRVRGRAEPGKLLLTIDTGGSSTTRTVPLAKPIAIPDALAAMLARSGRLRPNQSYTVDVFDPVSLAPASAIVTIGEEEEIAGAKGPVRALRTEMAYKGLRTVAWVTPDGETLKEESPMGWTLVRQSRAVAMQVPAGQPGTDLLFSTAVPANVPLRNPRQVRFLRAELTGADLSTLTLATDRQRLERPDSGLLEIRRESPRPEDAPRRPVRDAGVRMYLLPEVLIQSDDPAIAAAAREVVGEEANAWKAAVRIGRWVHETLEKSPAVSVPSALDVLRTRKGDCNEHTVLFVALARAAGIPAETCAGIVSLDDSFYYHAWPRVWGGRWVSMDPTFGQEIADATHIELVHGGLDRQAEILHLVGNLRVRIIKAEP